MNPIELLTTRRSVAIQRLVEPGPDEAELHSIVSAGIRVPDHGKLFPWRIQTLDSTGQSELGRICSQFFLEDNPQATQEQLSLEEKRPSHAPLLLIVTNRITRGHAIPELEQILSGGAVCQNLLNASHALGYAAKWLTEWPTYDSRVKEALGHNPETDMIGWIYVGTADETPPERKRATLTDVVSSWPAEQPQR